MTNNATREDNMRHINPVLVIVFLISGVVLSAQAAGTFDGKWIGTAPEAGDCGVLTVTLVVANNMVGGAVSGKHGSPSINPAPIASGGTAHVNYGRFQAGIRFSGDQFAGNFQTFCGVRDTTANEFSRSEIGPNAGIDGCQPDKHGSLQLA
jgi:hypothetical protein